MAGVKRKELEDVLDFLYNGEVSVDQEDLSDFLSVAERLKIKGLTKTYKFKPADEDKSEEETTSGLNHQCVECGDKFTPLSVLEMHLSSHRESRTDIMMTMENKDVQMASNDSLECVQFEEDIEVKTEVCFEEIRETDDVTVE